MVESVQARTFRATTNPDAFEPITRSEMEEYDQANEDLHTNQRLTDLKTLNQIFENSQDFYTFFNQWTGDHSKFGTDPYWEQE
jgi:hypothetical protein